ncbi:MAG: hypothetical protein ABIU11_01385 [Chitinophagaceae bacterium]
MNKIIVLLTIMTFSIFITTSCSKDSGSNNGGGGTVLDCNNVSNKAFAADVNPIIQSTCAVNGCHASGSFNGPGALTTYSQIFNARSIIRSSVASGSMPKNSSLSTSAKNSILCWIDSGAPNN